VQKQAVELQEQMQRDRLLAMIGRRIRQSLTLETILSTTVAGLRQLLKIDRGLIYRFNSDD
jgi:methyl-accepting chemotaxis protein PixJ